MLCPTYSTCHVVICKTPSLPLHNPVKLNKKGPFGKQPQRIHFIHLILGARQCINTYLWCTYGNSGTLVPKASRAKEMPVPAETDRNIWAMSDQLTRGMSMTPGQPCRKITTNGLHYAFCVTRCPSSVVLGAVKMSPPPHLSGNLAPSKALLRMSSRPRSCVHLRASRSSAGHPD